MRKALIYKRLKIKEIGLLLFLWNLIGAIPSVYTQEGYQWSNTAGSLTIFQPGDAVRIRVWELYQDEPNNINLSGDYPIYQDGSIVMPLMGKIMVKGLTVYELNQQLEEKLKAYLKHPYIMVRPLIRITMQGAFNKPGSYRVDPAESLWDLVAAAGGPSAQCDLRKMWVERGGRIVIGELLRSFEEGYSLEEVGVETGDQIIAPRRKDLDIGMLIAIVNLLASVVLLYLRLRTGSW